VLWHTYIGSGGDTNDWRDYGVISAQEEKKPAYFAFQLFTTELIPLSSVEPVEENAGKYVYKVIGTDDSIKYVAWGQGAWTLPEGMTKYTTVVPDAQNGYTWIPTASSLTLSALPVLVE
jgi:hypothetical protein